MAMARPVRAFSFLGLIGFSFALGGAPAALAATADITIDAEVVAALSVTEVEELNFGSVATSPVAGTVTVATDGNRNCGGGVTCIGGTPQAAEVLIQGTAGQGIDITLPASTLVSNGGENMTVDNFTATTLSTTLDGSGNATISIGGVLNVSPSQDTGSYTGVMTVTANYQ